MGSNLYCEITDNGDIAEISWIFCGGLIRHPTSWGHDRDTSMCKLSPLIETWNTWNMNMLFTIGTDHILFNLDISKWYYILWVWVYYLKYMAMSILNWYTHGHPMGMGILYGNFWISGTYGLIFSYVGRYFIPVGTT